jgi:hypothetical protein
VNLDTAYDLAKSSRICYIKNGKNFRFKPEDLLEKMR